MEAFSSAFSSELKTTRPGRCIVKFLERNPAVKMPHCVSAELCDFYGIAPGSSPLEMLQVTERLGARGVVPYPSEHRREFTNEALEFIALCVNPHERKWRDKRLLEAFRHLTAFEEKSDAFFSRGERAEFVAALKADVMPSFRLKTSSDPHAYDMTMIYTALTVMGVETNASTSPDALKFAFAVLFGPDDILISAVPAAITHLAHQCKRLTIASLLTSCENTNILYIPDFNSIAVFSSELSHLPTSILYRIAPANGDEAVVLAALTFSIDISSSEAPVTELAELRTSSTLTAIGRGITTNQGVSLETIEGILDTPFLTNIYRPHDKKFAAAFCASPVHYDIRYNWSQTFTSLYTQTQLRQFARAEGFHESRNGSFSSNESPAGAISGSLESSVAPVNIGDSVSALAYARLTPTFHLGRHPTSTNGVSPISLVELESLAWSEIVSYGVANGGPMTAYAIDDVADQFREMLSFTLPAVDGGGLEYISARALAKLKMCTKDMLRVALDPSEKTKVVFAKLEEAIKFTECRSLTLTSHGKKIAEIVKSKPEHAANIHSALRALLELGFYMRAWRVSPATEEGPPFPLPLSVEDCAFDNSRDDEVALNVTTAINAFENSLCRIESEEARLLISDAPLLKLHRPDGVGRRVMTEVPPQFITVTNPEQGVTVTERISIVKNGDSENVFSCIRTSSNFIVASAYFYLVAANSPSNFDIRNIEEIL